MLELAIADFCHTAVVALSFCLIGFELELFNLLFITLNLVEERFLAFPLSTLLLFVSTEGIDDFVEFCEFLLVALALDGFTFNLQLLEPTTEFVNLFGHRVTLHTKFSGSLIHQVDGLVGQEAVGDVTIGELYGGNDGLVLDTHFMVVLVTFLQASEDGYGGRHVGLIYHDGLETTFECLVLLKVLLVLVERGGTNGTQLSTSQSWLEDVGSIHSAASLSGSHKGMNLINEKDDLPLTLHNGFNHSLKSFLKLALILGSGNEGAHVERVELLVFEVFGHVATHDASRKTFNDGGLAGAGLANQDRIVFRSAAKNLQDSTNLFITPDNRVELAVLSSLHEVRCISFKNLLGRWLLPLLILIVVVHSCLCVLVRFR